MKKWERRWLEATGWEVREVREGLSGFVQSPGGGHEHYVREELGIWMVSAYRSGQHWSRNRWWTPDNTFDTPMAAVAWASLQDWGRL